MGSFMAKRSLPTAGAWAGRGGYCLHTAEA
jgi:hypothetical protein